MAGKRFQAGATGILFLYSAIHLGHSCSFSGVSRKESFGFGSSGQVNLVDTTAPMPTVEAKSPPPWLSSTWSPAYGALGPIRAFRVFPLWRTCQDDSGSEAGAWFIYGRLKNEYEVPQGQISITACDFSSSAAVYMAWYSSLSFSSDSSGRACLCLEHGATPFRCWPSILSPSKPHSPTILRTSACV